MKKSIIALSLFSVMLLGAPQAQALSCLPVDMYLESVVEDDTTQVFIGTATEVKNHTQVVTVSKVLKGYVAEKVWVVHPYSTDWQYYCSNGPAPVGKATIFLTIYDENSAHSVTQTIAADSEQGKNLIATLVKENVEAGVVEVVAEDRVLELKRSIVELLQLLLNLFSEMQYWQSQIN